MTIENQLSTETIDITEDINALVNGEELSEEFKQKAATIFEAAVVTRVKEELSKLEESFDQRVEDAVDQKIQGINEQIDGYLDYLAEQWISENELALESGIKNEITENFMNGLRGLFEEHYIDIPEDKVDLMGVYESKLEDASNEISELQETIEALDQLYQDVVKDKILSELAESLSELEEEKFKSLAEVIKFTSEDEYHDKLKTIKENYFTNRSSNNLVIESIVSDSIINEEVSDVKKSNNPAVNSYVKALDTYSR